MSSKLATASVWAMTGSGLQYVVLFLLLTYLTRILNPIDFGLMATLSIGLDLGLRVARWGQIELLQQPQHRTDGARNHAFRLSLAIACAPCLLFLAAAWPVGRYFESPELAVMALLCAPIILISAAGSTAEAILRNEFRFKQIAYRNTVCTLAGGVVAIALAMSGFGDMALAAQQLVQAALSAMWSWGAISWRPSLARQSCYDADISRQGGGIMLGSLLPQLIPRTFDLFVALLLGPVALGILRVAHRFNDFVGQMVFIPLVGVASSQFATLAADRRAMGSSYLQMTQASAAIICPILVGVGLVAPEAVPFLFGNQWIPSVPVVQILSLLALVMPVSYYFAPAMVALGQRRRVTMQSVTDVVFGLILAVVAAGISLNAIAVAIVLRCAFTSFCNAIDLRVHLKLSIRQIARQLAAPYTATLVMAASVTGARYVLSSENSQLAMLLVLSIVGAVAYLSTLIVGARLGLWPDYIVALSRLWSTPAQGPLRNI
jgi:O-antigen/teichoic acid export membrane protein